MLLQSLLPYLRSDHHHYLNQPHHLATLSPTTTSPPHHHSTFIMHFTTLTLATLSILASAYALPQFEKPESHFPPAPAAPHLPAEPFHAASAPTPSKAPQPQGWGFGGVASKIESEYSHISSAWSHPTATPIAWGPGSEPTHSNAWGSHPEPTQHPGFPSQPSHSAWSPEPTHPTGHPTGGFPWGPELSKTKTTMATVTTKAHSAWTHTQKHAPTMTMGAKVNWKGHGKGRVDDWVVERLAGFP